MNRLKNAANKGRNTFAKFRNPMKRYQIAHEMRQNFFSFQTFKRVFMLSALVYGVNMLKNWRINFYGSVSRMSGRVANIPLPAFAISPLLKLYWKFYNVNMEEISGQGIKDYNSFNSFFTRKLKDGWRTIEGKEDPRTICSPCDGTVFNFGDCEEDTFVIVKGTKYNLDEFLFGKSDDSQEYFSKILEKIKERGNDLKFILLYLSPGDYHRYHSPAIVSTNYRRHIAGSLFSVAPSYVKKNPSVFIKNERVSIFGEWIHGFFATTFIGATNVGSIVLNFDKDLITNRSDADKSDIFDKDYLKITELDGVFRNNIVIKKKSLRELDEDYIDISSDLSTFDIKDILSTDQSQQSLIYNEKEEHEFLYTLQNSFRVEDEDIEEFKFDDYQRNLIGKLENPENTVQKFSMTNKGILLEKGEELGYFNIGSSIMLLFEAPQSSKFWVEQGQKVKLGNTIVKTNIDIANKS